MRTHAFLLTLGAIGLCACSSSSDSPPASAQSNSDAGADGADGAVIDAAGDSATDAPAPTVFAKATKLDLLLMIDNSASMADKQRLFAQSIPDLVQRLTGLRVERDATGAFVSVEDVIEKGGDVTVPEASSVLAGSEIHPVEQAHGSLYVDQDVKMRLKLELTR